MSQLSIVHTVALCTLIPFNSAETNLHQLYWR